MSLQRNIEPKQSHLKKNPDSFRIFLFLPVVSNRSHAPQQMALNYLIAKHALDCTLLADFAGMIATVFSVTSSFIRQTSYETKMDY